MPGTPTGPGGNETTRSPVRMMAEVLRDEKLSAEDKQLLYDLARTRFQHRRYMAYIALFGLIGFSVAKFFRPEVDITWINVTLAGIVAVYYGVSGFRPGS